jgi:hypothetical protein
LSILRDQLHWLRRAAKSLAKASPCASRCPERTSEICQAPDHADFLLTLRLDGQYRSENLAGLPLPSCYTKNRGK